MANDLGIEVNNTQPFVFISYTSEDTQRVSELLKQIITPGVNVWYDHGLKYGDNQYWATISENIDKAEVVLMFISNITIKKGESGVFKEYDLAREFDESKIIIPVFLEEIRKKEIPYKNRERYIKIDKQQRYDAYTDDIAGSKRKRLAEDIRGYLRLSHDYKDHSETPVVKPANDSSYPSWMKEVIDAEPLIKEFAKEKALSLSNFSDELVQYAEQHGYDYFRSGNRITLMKEDWRDRENNTVFYLEYSKIYRSLRLLANVNEDGVSPNKKAAQIMPIINHGFIVEGKDLYVFKSEQLLHDMEQKKCIDLINKRVSLLSRIYSYYKTAMREIGGSDISQSDIVFRCKDETKKIFDYSINNGYKLYSRYDYPPFRIYRDYWWNEKDNYWFYVEYKEVPNTYRVESTIVVCFKNGDTQNTKLRDFCVQYGDPEWKGARKNYRMKFLPDVFNKAISDEEIIGTLKDSLDEAERLYCLYLETLN